MNEPKLTLDFFIDFFSAVPEDKWCTGQRKKNDKYCSLGLVHSDLFLYSGDKAEEFLIQKRNTKMVVVQ